MLLDYRIKSPEICIKKFLEPIIAPLQRFKHLQIFIHAENIPLAQRKEKEKIFKDEIEKWHNQTKRTFTHKVFYDVYGTPTGCCEDWFKNIWLTFQNTIIDRIVYLPYDIIDMDPPATPGKTDKRLQDFIGEVNKGDIDLLLGTYEAKTDPADARDDTTFFIPLDRTGNDLRQDIRKNLLEEFTIVELWSAFPKTMAWFCQQRNDPKYKPVPRTGFFGLSRELFQEFIMRPWRPTMLPWAGTVQLLICAGIRTRQREKDEKQGYKVAEKFVANLKQPPELFTAYGFAHQRERISYVIADERYYWTRQLPELDL